MMLKSLLQLQDERGNEIDAELSDRHTTRDALLLMHKEAQATIRKRYEEDTHSVDTLFAQLTQREELAINKLNQELTEINYVQSQLEAGSAGPTVSNAQDRKFHISQRETEDTENNRHGR